MRDLLREYEQLIDIMGEAICEASGREAPSPMPLSNWEAMCVLEALEAAGYEVRCIDGPEGVGHDRPCVPPRATDRERGSAPAPSVTPDQFDGDDATARVHAARDELLKDETARAAYEAQKARIDAHVHAETNSEQYVALEVIVRVGDGLTREDVEQAILDVAGCEEGEISCRMQNMASTVGTLDECYRWLDPELFDGNVDATD